MNRKTAITLLLLILAAAFAARLIPTLMALGFPERIARPDTPTYLEPAKALISGEFSGTGRAPGYIWLAAGARLASEHHHRLLLALAGVLLSTLTLLPVWAGTRLLAGSRAALAATALMALNLTAIANAPMLLSDTLFGFFAAWQFFFFIRFYRRKRSGDFLLSVLTAALGTLIRPINLPWLAPALVLLWFLSGIDRRRKALNTLGAVLIYAAVLLPWMARNAAAGAPWCIDTNTGAMLHQNGAMILAEANKSSYEDEKQRLRQEFDTLFPDKTRFPDEKSREEWKIARLKKIIAAHPFIALKQHFNWHRILLPDAPTLFELAGLTRSDRGTMEVLTRRGLIAAVDHYFEGRWYLPCALLPLLLFTGLVYLGCAAVLCGAVLRFRKRFFLLLLFLAFAEFYLFLPGPICAPRYQIPALPVMCAFAGLWLVFIFRKLKKGKTK